MSGKLPEEKQEDTCKENSTTVSSKSYEKKKKKRAWTISVSDGGLNEIGFLQEVLSIKNSSAIRYNETTKLFE